MRNYRTAGIEPVLFLTESCLGKEWVLNESCFVSGPQVLFMFRCCFVSGLKQDRMSRFGMVPEFETGLKPDSGPDPDRTATDVVYTNA